MAPPEQINSYSCDIPRYSSQANRLKTLAVKSALSARNLARGPGVRLHRVS